MVCNFDYFFESDIHQYKFREIDVLLTLTPSIYLFPDFDKTINLLLVDIIRTGVKRRVDIGCDICELLSNFLESNKNYAIGFYTSTVDDKEMARITLFNNWFLKHIHTEEFAVIKNEIEFMDESILTFQVYFHNDYPNQNLLIEVLNKFSADISEK